MQASTVTIRRRALIAALGIGLLAAPTAGSAELDVGGAVLSGEVEAGGRTVGGEFDSAKYQEYRELRPGAFGSLQFLLEDSDDPYYLRGWLTDIGEDDQRYQLELGRWGRYRLELEFAELPHVFSNQARSLHQLQGDSVLALPSGLQSALQALAPPPFVPPSAQSAGLAAALAKAPETALEFRLRTGRAALSWTPLASLRVRADYSLQDRQGTRPFALGFGNPGGTFINVAAPIDEQIHEVNGALQWTKETWNVELGYTGSFFENDLDANGLIVDNPLVAADAAGDPSRGRVSLDPDNSAHTFRIAGGATLPLGFPARVSGTVSYGRRRQNEDFLCHTINTALLATPDACRSPAGAALTLPETNLDGEVRTFLVNLVSTARPTRELNLTARYRLYDYDNKTPALTLPAHVENDADVVTSSRISVPNEYRRHRADVDAAYRIASGVTLRAGVDWERWKRSRDREVRELDEYGGELGLDLRASAWARVRGTYAYSVRNGSRYETFAFLSQTVPASDFDAAKQTSQLESLRKFDQADRKRHRLQVLATVVARDDLDFTLSGQFSQSDFDDTDFGLTELERFSIGGDVSYRPAARVGLSAWYSFESLRYEQRSRWRGRSFAPIPCSPPGLACDDPRNDWSSINEDRIHTGGVRVDWIVVRDLVEASLGYTVQHARATNRTRGAAGFLAAAPPTTGGDGGAPFDYPTQKDVLQTIDLTLQYHLEEDWTLRAQYRWERLDLTSFRRDDLDPFEAASNVNGSGGVSPSLDVFLADRVGDYDAHIFALSVVYEF